MVKVGFNSNTLRHFHWNLTATCLQIGLHLQHMRGGGKGKTLQVSPKLQFGDFQKGNGEGFICNRSKKRRRSWNEDSPQSGVCTVGATPAGRTFSQECMILTTGEIKYWIIMLLPKTVSRSLVWSSGFLDTTTHPLFSFRFLKNNSLLLCVLLFVLQFWS